MEKAVCAGMFSDHYCVIKKKKIIVSYFWWGTWGQKWSCKVQTFSHCLQFNLVEYLISVFLHQWHRVSCFLLQQVRVRKETTIREGTIRVSRKNDCVQLWLHKMLRGSPHPAHYCSSSMQVFFQINWNVFSYVLFQGSFGHGRPASSMEYNRLPLTSNIQSSPQLYQTGHVQTSHVEGKKKIL